MAEIEMLEGPQHMVGPKRDVASGQLDSAGAGSIGPAGTGESVGEVADVLLEPSSAAIGQFADRPEGQAPHEQHEQAPHHGALVPSQLVVLRHSSSAARSGHFRKCESPGSRGTAELALHGQPARRCDGRGEESSS